MRRFSFQEITTNNFLEPNQDFPYMVPSQNEPRFLQHHQNHHWRPRHHCANSQETQAIPTKAVRPQKNIVSLDPINTSPLLPHTHPPPPKNNIDDSIVSHSDCTADSHMMPLKGKKSLTLNKIYGWLSLETQKEKPPQFFLFIS